MIEPFDCTWMINGRFLQSWWFLCGSEIQLSKEKKPTSYMKKKKRKKDYIYIFEEVINKIIFQTCQHYLHSNPLAMTRNFYARFIAIQECVRIKSSAYHMT